MEWFKGLSPGRRAFAACGLLVLSVLAAALTMHYERGSTAETALDDVFKKHPQLQRHAVARFAGHVTIDGQPPSDLAEDLALFVSLHAKGQIQLATRALQAKCDSTGHFAFSTYLKEDGAAVGSYIVTIVKLRRVGRARRSGFGPPDELKNLYNDPDKNVDKPEFVVDVEMPGKTDVHFDLAVEGQESIEIPGRHAITRVATW